MTFAEIGWVRESTVRKRVEIRMNHKTSAELQYSRYLYTVQAVE